MKNFVVDTNVIINDPNCLNKFGKNRVIVPLVVLEEIDNFKKGNSSQAQAARGATRILDQLRERGRLDKGVKLDNGGELVVDSDFPAVRFTDTIQKNKNDNIILQSVLDWQDSEKYQDPVLVTEDINLRVRGDALGIKTEGYKNTRVDDVSFYDEVPELYCSDKLMEELYSAPRREISWAALGPDDEEVRKFVRGRSDTLNQNFVLKTHSGSSALVRNVYGGFRAITSGKQVAYGIGPRNKEQAFALDLLLDKEIQLVVLVGKAGCGKTLLALACGLEQVVERPDYEQVMISRPTISMGKEVGFLPGDLDEKLNPWMAPIYDNMDYLHRNGDKDTKGEAAIETLKQYGKVSIDALSYIRGRSLSGKYALIDEAQNLTSHEIKSIVTRAGQGTKMVFTGDPYQIDNPYLDQYSNGLSFLIDRFQGHELFGSVTLISGERSELAEAAAKRL